MEWKLADVDKLIVSPEGEIRGADIHTAKGKTNNSVSKLNNLEITETFEASSDTVSQTNVADSKPRPKRKAAIAVKERIQIMAEK